MTTTPLSKSFPRPPRDVRRAHGLPSAILLRILSLAILVAFIIALGKFTSDAIVHYQGDPVAARVTRTWTTHGKRTNYHVAYAYDVNQQHFSEDESIPQRDYVRFTVGQTVPAKTAVFLGLRSASLELGDSSWWSRRAPFAIIPAILAIVAAFTFNSAFLSPLRDKHTLEIGDPVEGFVEDKHTRRNKNGRTYYIRFRYTLHPGEWHSRQIKTSRTTFDATDINQKLTILLDPAHPKRGVPLELCDFEIVT